MAGCVAGGVAGGVAEGGVWQGVCGRGCVAGGVWQGVCGRRGCVRRGCVRRGCAYLEKRIFHSLAELKIFIFFIFARKLVNCSIFFRATREK